MIVVSTNTYGHIVSIIGCYEFKIAVSSYMYHFLNHKYCLFYLRIKKKKVNVDDLLYLPILNRILLS